jgi:SpoVK/Ycf46/Vps4 family AAA+-type ATPase
LGDFDQRLRPRGILLDGVPGTGKTVAAKWIAQEIGVQLLRLDLGAIKGKWVGESEGALRDALAQVDRESPCVLLLDEVEKLFAQSREDPVAANLLASILWWLAEHHSQVLTVMTTNDKDGLPRELWRSGRLDETLKLPGLPNISEAAGFARGLAETFGYKPRKDALARGLQELAYPAPQATVEAMVKRGVRRWLTSKTS